MRKALFFSALLAIYLQAGGQFSITGKVERPDGSALAGATVYFKNSYLGTISSNTGEFKFSRVSGGDYYLYVSFVGFETDSVLLSVYKDMNVVFRLEKMKIGLEEVVVMASRAGWKDPVAADFIQKQQIDKANLGQDIPFLLSLSPSLVQSSDAGNGIGYSGFRIRGTDANRINITIDGIPLNDAESHGVWWVNLPDFASSVEDIQIQRGAGTSTAGAAAFGASVNLRTSGKSEKPYAEFNSGYGSFGTYKSSNSIGTGLMENGLSFDFRYSLIGSQGYIERAESGLTSIFATASYSSGRNLLRFNLISGKEKTYQAWDGVPSYLLGTNRRYNGIGAYTDAQGRLVYYDNETDNYSQNHLQLHFSRQMNVNWLFSASMHYTSGKGYYEQYREDEPFAGYGIPDAILGDSIIQSGDLIRQKWLDNDFFGAVFSMNYTSGKLNFRAGGSANRYIGDHFGEVIWAGVNTSFDRGFRWYQSQGLKDDYNVYGKMNYQINEKLSMYGDLQARKIDYHIEGRDDDLRNITQNHHFLFMNPKFGLNYSLAAGQRFFFSFGTAHREPNRDNFVDADPGQPHPVPEALYDYEAGYSLKAEKYRFDINLYFMDYNNQLVLTGEINDVGAPVMSNVKDSYRAGIELSAGIRIFPSLEWSSNLSLSRNRILNLTTYTDNWDYWNDTENEPYQYETFLKQTSIAFSPEITANSILTWKFRDNLGLDFRSKYVGMQYIDNTSSAGKTLSPWFVNDLVLHCSIETGFAEALSLNLMILNIFNHMYESNAWVYSYYYQGVESKLDGYFPQAGIHFLTGMKLRF